MAHETIPVERLPESILQREIEDVLASSGNVERRRGVRIGPEYTLDMVMAEGFDATLIAFGLGKSLTLPGVKRPDAGVTGALEFLASAKLGEKVSGRALVIGGGNTAIDAALAAKRAGASDVSIVYRRSFSEMPAWPEERDQAIREGVHFLVLTQPIRYVTDADGVVTGLKAGRTMLGAPGKDGRRAPELIHGSEHIIAADLVVEAIGQQMDDGLKHALEGVGFSDDGLVWVDSETMETSRPGVFAAGDIINGGTTVVAAVAEGTRAARQIDAFLRG